MTFNMSHVWHDFDEKAEEGADSRTRGNYLQKRTPPIRSSFAVLHTISYLACVATIPTSFNGLEDLTPCWQAKYDTISKLLCVHLRFRLVDIHALSPFATLTIYGPPCTQGADRVLTLQLSDGSNRAYSSLARTWIHYYQLFMSIYIRKRSNLPLEERRSFDYS